MPLPSPSLLDKGVCLVEGAEWKGNLWLGHEKPLWFQMSKEDVILDLSFCFSLQYSAHLQYTLSTHAPPPQQCILCCDLTSHTSPLR